MYQAIDISLHKQDVVDILRYSSFDANQIIRLLIAKQVNLYIDKHFIRSDHHSSTPSNCYHVGACTFSRKDKTPMSQHDHYVLTLLNLGQINSVSGKPGDRSLTHIWECDSGD